jgi:hypothetical protein
MAIAKITVRTVEQLAPGSRIWDTVVQGFGVRRQTDGAYYYLRFRKNGVQQMRSIGRHGSPWTCETARKEAQRLLGALVGGGDPFAKPVPAEALGAEVERYLSRQQAALKPRTYVELERHLRRDCGPLARLRLAEIDRRTIALRLAEVETASAPLRGTEFVQAYQPSSTGPSAKGCSTPTLSLAPPALTSADHGIVC